MGRRGKNGRQLKRRMSATFRMLILCEDSGGGFKYLKRRFRGSGKVRVHVRPGQNPDVKNLLREASQIVKSGDEADVVALVFDRDHRFSGFDRALKICADNDRLLGIGSAPSMEYWFVVHIEDCAPTLVAAKQMVAKLRQLNGFSTYEKGTFDVYRALEINGDELAAIERASRHRKQLLLNGGVVPRTDIDVLCKMLGDLASRQNGFQARFEHLKGTLY